MERQRVANTIDQRNFKMKCLVLLRLWKLREPFSVTALQVEEQDVTPDHGSKALNTFICQACQPAFSIHMTYPLTHNILRWIIWQSYLAKPNSTKLVMITHIQLQLIFRNITGKYLGIFEHSSHCFGRYSRKFVDSFWISLASY